jgi:anthranilate synthase/aminodeoxychorismate synthase-like glutamine amidotransferase
VILLIDNYDSFVFNLERYFRRLGQTTCVLRNDAVDLEKIRREPPTAIVFSPGPCAPPQAGMSLEVARELSSTVPMLGVCLGHQILAEAFGGRVVRSAKPMHGRTSSIEHDGLGVFQQLSSPLRVCRYHSLVVERESLPDCLTATAHSPDQTLMAFRHRSLPVVGLQFHPEAILTEHGFDLLRNFLRSIGVDAPAVASEMPASVHREREQADEAYDACEALQRPITF